MPNLLKTNNRVSNAVNFRESLGRTAPDPEYLYLFFGKDSPWADENVPDTPDESIDDEFVTRADILGIKRVAATDTAFVAPRYTWTTGDVYIEYDSSDADLLTKEFYVITSAFNVYKCLDNNAGGTSVVEPTGTSTSPFSTGDGYTWKFMFDISSSLQATFLTSVWMPVPAGAQRSSFQTAVENSASYVAGNPSGGHGSNAKMELGAYSVMIAQALEQDEGGVFPIDDDFRQYGLWRNPELISTGDNASAETYVVNDSSSDIDENSGDILLVDNRIAIQRYGDQSESFKLVMQF